MQDEKRDGSRGALTEPGTAPEYEPYEILHSHYFRSKGHPGNKDPNMIRLTIDMDRRAWRRVRHLLLQLAKRPGEP